MGQTGICGHGLCESQMNVNKEMMFGVLLVLMFGPDTGPLLLLSPQAMGPRSPHVRTWSACLKTSLLDLLLCHLMLMDTSRPGSLDCSLAESLLPAA